MSLIIDENEKEQNKQIFTVKQSLLQMAILLGLSFIGIFIMLMTVFIIVRILPESYSFISPQYMSQSQLDEIYTYMELWGYNDPFISQFFKFYRNIFSGNCGDSDAVGLNSDIFSGLCVIGTRIVSLVLFLAIFLSVVLVNFRKYDAPSDTFSEPIIENIQLEGSNKSKKFASKEIFRNLKRKILIQLIVLGISFALVMIILNIIIFVK